MTPNRFPLVIFGLGALVVVVAVISLRTGSLVWLGIAVAALLTATVIVVWGSVRTTQTGDETDPRSEELDRRAQDAVGDRPRNVETELEALKRE
jgi:membrane protein implicated in regulation of membrane protease activity